MEKKLDQRICLKFCVANGISCSESLRMLRNSFKDACMSKTQAYDWYKSFKAGRELVNDMPRSGRPSTSTTEENIESVQRIVGEHRNIGIRKIAQKLKISYGSAKYILAELSGMKRVARRLSPRKLTALQKDLRLNMAKEMNSKMESDSAFINRLITGGETWICANDVKFPANSDRTGKKILLLSVFFDYRGLLHYEFLLPDQNIDEKYYLDVFSRLFERIEEQRPDLWETNSFVLHFDVTQKSPAIRDFISKHSPQVIEQVECAGDMSPCEFFLFPRLKVSLKGRLFESSEAIRSSLLEELNEIPAKSYQECMNDLTARWKMCIAHNGDYFDEDDDYK